MGQEVDNDEVFWDVRDSDLDFVGMLGKNSGLLLDLEPVSYEPQEGHSLAHRRHLLAKARQSNRVTSQALRTAARVVGGTKPAMARLLREHAELFEVGARG